MSEPKVLYVLLAPAGQLCGNGQLRESIYERRERRGADYPMWYLNPDLTKKFQLTEENEIEAVVAEDSSAIAWLKLRFGGERANAQLNTEELWEHAGELPKPDERRDIGFKKTKQ